MTEAWNCMPRLNVQALRKPLETDVEITAPRYMRGDHYTFSCSLEISFLRFSRSRRRHNASYFQNILRTGHYQSGGKVMYNF